MESTKMLAILVAITFVFSTANLYFIFNLNSKFDSITGQAVATNEQTNPAGEVLSTENLKKYAKELGLDTNKFNTCLDSGKMAEEVQSDFKDGESYGVEGTPAFFINGILISGAQPFEAFKAIIEAELAGTSNESEKVQVSEDDDAAKGSADAPITMIIFSDYQCPYCAAAEGHNQALIAQFKQKYPAWTAPVPEIIKNYVNTGKVKLVFRDYPLGFHEFAQKAAEASECAHEQGKFWEYHDKLFSIQG